MYASYNWDSKHMKQKADRLERGKKRQIYYPIIIGDFSTHITEFEKKKTENP